jgi:hypothetical protein
MERVGFQNPELRSYTGFKSSPYTEGAIFYAQKSKEIRKAGGPRREH